MFNALNIETLKRRAPAIFSEDCAVRTSDKYQHISTVRIIDGLFKEGFVPIKVEQSRSRTANKKAYAKHLLRFRHIDARPTASGLFPEIVLINSHDGLSSYRLLSGVYRVICMNGLVAGTTYEEVRIRHQGDIINGVIEGTYKVIENSKKMLESAREMETIILSEDEKQLFADAAHQLRFENDELGAAIKPSQLLSPRRYEEKNKSDLFTVFNIAQENSIKGGLSGYKRNERGLLKRVSTRAIKSIDQNTALNRALWTLTEQMMKLKTSSAINV